MKNCSNVTNCIKGLVFSSITVLIFMFMQNLFAIRSTPVSSYNWGLAGLKELDYNSTHILFLGTSHCYCGVSPMELYAEGKIHSYNLASSAQNTPISYYMLMEFLERQTPDVVIMDSNALFVDINYGIGVLRDRIDRVLNETSFNKNKIKLCMAYPCDSFQEKIKRLFCPFWACHSRWNILSEDNGKTYFPTRGYICLTKHVETENVTALDIDRDISLLKERNYVLKELYHGGMHLSSQSYAPFLDEIAMSDWSKKYFERIVEECRKRDIRLVLMKVPTRKLIQFYHSTWCREKSEYVRRLADEYGLDFIDLVYDFDLGMDWSTDSMDGGCHLNYRGAKKVSRFLADYIKKHYSLSEKKDNKIEHEYRMWADAQKIFDLQTETSIESYAEMLRDFDNAVAFFSIRDGNLYAPDDRLLAEKSVLKSFGFRSDFSDTDYSDSFIGVLDGGSPVYECVSNREQDYDYEITKGKALHITSSGFLTGSDASMPYSMNAKGLNIVVYDISSGLEIDSLCYTQTEDGSFGIVHNNDIIGDLCFEYQAYLGRISGYGIR